MNKQSYQTYCESLSLKELLDEVEFLTASNYMVYMGTDKDAYFQEYVDKLATIHTYRTKLLMKEFNIS